MSMDFFLPKHLHEPLRQKLSGIPDLVEDLAVTITRQARVQKGGLGKPSRSKPESRLPFHIAAAEAADELQNCLATWVRAVCEERQVHYTDHDDVITLARWLRKNVVSLALTQGSEESYADIVERIDHCRHIIDLPPDDDVVIDRARVDSANKSVVTLATIGGIASRLGDLGQGLNRERLRLLAKRGDVSAVSTDPDTKTKFYRLGDVLHAHHNRDRRHARK